MTWILPTYMTYLIAKGYTYAKGPGREKGYDQGLCYSFILRSSGTNNRTLTTHLMHVGAKTVSPAAHVPAAQRKGKSLRNGQS
jgi:hypothetical protein